MKDNSPAIDAGTVVGLATDYYGNLICGPPDIGAFEAQTCSINSLPACIGFIIENDTPSLLELTFSLALKNVIPAISSFIVQVNSITRNVNSIAISGNQVLLTLSSPVFSNDVVTVTYLKPSVNPVQSASGVQAGSFTDQLVINESTGISSKKYKVTISPNPAHDYIDISINGLSQTIDFIRIVNFSGKIVLEYKFSQAFILLHLPINLTAGIYIIQVGLGKVVLSTQKLVVRI